MKPLQFCTRANGTRDTADANQYDVWDSSLSDSGAAYPMFRKTTQISRPPPASALLLVDESVNTVDDCILGMSWAYWRNSPTVRHAKGCAFSFADGHVERWQWLGLCTEQYGNAAASGASLEDLNRMLNDVAWQ